MPMLHYLSLRDEFLAFDPDLVILWYDQTDLQEDSWFQKNLLYDEHGRLIRADPYFRGGRFDHWEWLKNHSAIAKYLDTKLIRTVSKIRILGLRGYLKTKLQGERAKAAIARLKAAQKPSDLPEYDRFFLYRESATEESARPYWMVSANYVLLIRDLLAEHHILFGGGFCPLGMIVGPDQWATGRVAWGFERGRAYDASVALSLYQEFSEAEHIPFLNPLESFRAAGKTEKLFYDIDGHLTPAGHRVLAEHVLRDPTFLTLLQTAIRRAAGEPQHVAQSR